MFFFQPVLDFPAHIAHLFRIFLVVLYGLPQCREVHLPVIPAAEVIHQLTNLIGSFISSIDVDDMLFITEWLLQFGDDSLDMIERQAVFENVIFRDEYDIRLWQFFPVFAARQTVLIQQAAVEPGSLAAGSLVAALDLDVILALLGIGRMNVQPYAPAMETGNRILDDDR